MTDTWTLLQEELVDVFKRTAHGIAARGPAETRDDLDMLRRLIVERRDPKICIVGSSAVPLEDAMSALGTVSGWEGVRERLGAGRWYEHTLDGGTVHVADLRGAEAPSLQALEYQSPDVVVALMQAGQADVDDTARVLVNAMDYTDDIWGSYPAGIAAVLPSSSSRGEDEFGTIQHFRDALGRCDLPRDWVDVVATSHGTSLSRAVLRDMPLEARFALARISSDAATKRDVAFEMVRLAGTLNAAIAGLPIPFPSFLPITSVQIGTVAGIAILAGRTPTLGSVGEFAAAIGLNVGAGIAFRELARAFAQWIPVAGPVISASIAAGATLTVGKAAMRYYLD